MHIAPLKIAAGLLGLTCILYGLSSPIANYSITSRTTRVQSAIFANKITTKEASVIAVQTFTIPEKVTATSEQASRHSPSLLRTFQLPIALFAAAGALFVSTLKKGIPKQDDELMHITVSKAVVATAVTAAAIGNVTIADSASAFGFVLNEQQLYTDAWKAVQDIFIDRSFNGLDWEQVKKDALTKPLATRQETYAEIRSSLDLLGDPFTRLLDPPQYNNIKRRLTGRLTGVGLEIVPVTEGNVKKMKVVDRTLDGPADKAGIKDDDLILALDGAPIGELNQWEIADKVIGDRNSQLTLTVQTPGQEPHEVPLVRDNVTFQSVKYGICDDVPNQSWDGKTIEHLGYVRVPSFNYSTAAEFNKALKELTAQGADGVVIDLRSDTGGSLNAAYEMANSILPSGEIVRVINGKGEVTSAQVRGRALFPDIPVTLLVDDHTASSSEVLGAALKAAGRAAIAGEQTFGKGIIQDIKVLGDGSALFVTKERYLTPLNEEIDRIGITPTVAVKKDLLNTKTGLRVEPAQFCSDMVREAPPLFSGTAPAPGNGHADLDLNALSAFC